MNLNSNSRARIWQRIGAAAGAVALSGLIGCTGPTKEQGSSTEQKKDAACGVALADPTRAISSQITSGGCNGDVVGGGVSGSINGATYRCDVYCCDGDTAASIAVDGQCLPKAQACACAGTGSPSMPSPAPTPPPSTGGQQCPADVLAGIFGQGPRSVQIAAQTGGTVTLSANGVTCPSFQCAGGVVAALAVDDACVSDAAQVCGCAAAASP